MQCIISVIILTVVLSVDYVSMSSFMPFISVGALSPNISADPRPYGLPPILIYWCEMQLESDQQPKA